MSVEWEDMAEGKGNVLEFENLTGIEIEPNEASQRGSVADLFL